MNILVRLCGAFVAIGSVLSMWALFHYEHVSVIAKQINLPLSLVAYAMAIFLAAPWLAGLMVYGGIARGRIR